MSAPGPKVAEYPNKVLAGVVVEAAAPAAAAAGLGDCCGRRPGEEVGEVEGGGGEGIVEVSF